MPSELSQSTKELTEKFSLWRQSLKKKDAQTIHVDEVASRVAAFYEQIRTIIDWKEEHLMRRAAIIRKLKRRFLDLELNNFAGDNMAEPLVLELIRGGFFPNDRIDETKIAEVQKVIAKYVFILKHNPENKKGKAGVQFYNRIMEIAACEIEETLAPSLKEMSLIDYMFGQMKESIKVSDGVYKKGLLLPEEKDIQIYIAVQRALFKFDEPIISYNLLKYKYAYWDNASEEELFKISQNIYKICQELDRDLAHVLSKKFYNICEKYDTPYLILEDILAQDDSEKAAKELSDPSLLEPAIRRTYAKRLSDLKVKIKRAAIYSIISIFITKILTLVIIEIILAKLFHGHLNFWSLATDVLIPTVLMAVLVATVKKPSPRNLQIVIGETIKIVYKKEKVDVYEIRAAKQRGIITRLFLSLVYLAGAVFFFWILYSVFTFFNLPLSSIIIDFIFIALILFAGTAVQRKAKELTMENESEGFLSFFSDIIFLPVTGAGQWMANTWKQYNAIAAFFNALIDMPFASFVEFIERWRNFIKERKEEM